MMKKQRPTQSDIQSEIWSKEFNMAAKRLEKIIKHLENSRENQLKAPISPLKPSRKISLSDGLKYFVFGIGRSGLIRISGPMSEAPNNRNAADYSQKKYDAARDFLKNPIGLNQENPSQGFEESGHEKNISPLKRLRQAVSAWLKSGL